MSQKLLRYAMHLVVFATFCVPLIVMPTSFIFPFIVPKVVMFRSLVTVMAGLFVLITMAEKRKVAWYRSSVIVSVMLFILSFAFSTVVGTDPYHSFWDNHERMLGLFTILHYGLYFFILTMVYTTWSEWKWLLRGILFAGSIVMFIGLLQVFNPDYLLNQGSNRVASTLGNSIYVGGYGLFLFFTAALLMLQEKKIWWHVVELVGAVLALIGILFSGSRGSMLGLGAGILVALVSYVFTLKQAPRARKAIAGVLIVGFLGALFLYGSRHSQWVADIPALDRTLNSGITETMNSPRWIAWQIAWESWKDKPVFGWGPNNFFYAFNKFYHPRSLEFGYGETWFDNAHNIIMNTLAVQGILGLLSYVGIFITAWYCLVLGRKRYSTPLHVTVIGSAFLVAHFVQNVTVFENPTSYLYFMLWLAMVNAMTQKPANAQSVAVVDVKAPLKFGSVSWLAVGVVGAFVVLFISIFDLQPARANQAAFQAMLVSGSGTDESIAMVEKVMQSHSPHIDDIRADISRNIVTSVDGNFASLGAERSNKMLSIAREALTANIELHPLDIRNSLMLAQLEQTAARVNNDGRYLAAAEEALNLAMENSPARQQVIYALAWVKAQRGDIQGSLQLLSKALEEDPKVGESYWRLMFILKNVGLENEMQTVWKRAQAEQVRFTDQELSTINSLLNSPPMNAPTSTAKGKTTTKKK